MKLYFNYFYVNFCLFSLFVCFLCFVCLFVCLVIYSDFIFFVISCRSPIYFRSDRLFSHHFYIKGERQMTIRFNVRDLGEISPHQRIEPEAPVLQIRCSPVLRRNFEIYLKRQSIVDYRKLGFFFFEKF